MGQGRMLWMGDEPVVDEALDGPAPAQRGADEVATPLGVEVLDQLRVAGKSKDDLQAVMNALRGGDFGLPLQFINYR